MSLRFNLIKDIDSFKNDAFLGLTVKEVCLCAAAIVVGGATYFTTHGILGEDLSSILCLVTGGPFGLIALYKKNGMSFIEYVKAYRELKVNNNTLYYSSYDVDLLEASNQSKTEENRKGRVKKHGR